jgi:hypothetical protein
MSTIFGHWNISANSHLPAQKNKPARECTMSHVALVVQGLMMPITLLGSKCCKHHPAIILFVKKGNDTLLTKKVEPGPQSDDLQLKTELRTKCFTLRL